MEINVSDRIDLLGLATAAGFASVDDYVNDLIQRDAERLAIQVGIDAMRAGRIKPIEEDGEFRRQYGLSQQPRRTTT